MGGGAQAGGGGGHSDSYLLNLALCASNNTLAEQHVSLAEIPPHDHPKPAHATNVESAVISDL